MEQAATLLCPELTSLSLASPQSSLVPLEAVDHNLNQREIERLGERLLSTLIKHDIEIDLADHPNNIQGYQLRSSM